MFARIIYNNIFEYLTTNKLISYNQSGFKPSKSFVNQLLSITNEIYHSLDNGLEVYFLIYQKLLTMYDMKAWYSN